MNEEFAEILVEARREILDIILKLIDKRVDLASIYAVLSLSREDAEYIQLETMQSAIKIAKKADEIGLSVDAVEKITNVDRVVFIEYMKEVEVGRRKPLEK